MLAGIFGSERLLPATVSFVDIAGIVKGASEGAGLGNKFLATSRESDAICQVIRVFTDADVTVVCYKGGTVKANHAFSKGQLDDAKIDAIVKASCALVE